MAKKLYILRDVRKPRRVRAWVARDFDGEVYVCTHKEPIRWVDKLVTWLPADNSEFVFCGSEREYRRRYGLDAPISGAGETIAVMLEVGQ